MHIIEYFMYHHKNKLHIIFVLLVILFTSHYDFLL